MEEGGGLRSNSGRILVRSSNLNHRTAIIIFSPQEFSAPQICQMQNKCCGVEARTGQIKSILVVSQSGSRKELLAQTASGGMGERKSKKINKKIQNQLQWRRERRNAPRQAPAKNEVALAKSADKIRRCAKKKKIEILYVHKKLRVIFSFQFFPLLLVL